MLVFTVIGFRTIGLWYVLSSDASHLIPNPVPVRRDLCYQLPGLYASSDIDYKVLLLKPRVLAEYMLPYWQGLAVHQSVRY